MCMTFNWRTPSSAFHAWLIQQEPKADLTYMEDDLVVADPLFLDKQHWFLNRTVEELVMMPHRFETLPPAPRHGCWWTGRCVLSSLYFCTPQANAVRGR